MKPFNLEEYLKNPSRKIVTRSGKTVKKILCTDARGDYPIIALVDWGNHDIPLSFTKDGKFFPDKTFVHDLFFVSEKNERWVNLYKDNGGIYASMDTFKTKEEAEALSCRTCIATVKVEWEE